MTELTYLSAALLGLIQGVTEFLPVSSSGHLVIVQSLLGLQGDSPSMLLFDVVTHFGTLLAVLAVFFGTLGRFVRRLAREASPSFEGKRSAFVVLALGVVASLPTAAIGLGFKDTFESAFASPTATGVGLLITGTFLFATGFCPRPRRGWRRIGWPRAAVVGIVQGLAIFPGISRSGSTISVALFLGIKRRWAAEFSFLIAAPAIAGATLIKLRETFTLPSGDLERIPWGPIAAGSLLAFVSGVIALRILLWLVVGDRIHHFAYYCWAVGIVVLGWAIGR